MSPKKYYKIEILPGIFHAPSTYLLSSTWGRKDIYTKDNHFINKKGKEKASHEAYEERGTTMRAGTSVYIVHCCLHSHLEPYPAHSSWSLKTC